MNNIKISGRIVADPVINEKNNRITFRILHNFGGDRDPLALDFVAFKTKKGFPKGVEGLKKGSAVVVTAFQRPNNFTNEEGQVKYRVQLLVKTVAENKENESVNDFSLSGRLAADPEENGKTITFRIIHNFGGDLLAPMGQSYVAFADKSGKWPEGVKNLKKGSPVVVNAFQRPNNFTNKEGDKLYRNQVIVKNVTAWVPDAKAEAEAKEEAEAVEVATE